MQRLHHRGAKRHVFAPPPPHTCKGLYSQVGDHPNDQALIDKLSDEYAPVKLGVEFSPFAVGCRKYTMRHGAQAWPMAGVGAFVESTSAPLYIGVVSLSQLMLSTGMLHMERIAQSMEHKGAKNLEVTKIMLKPGDMAWIPFGMIAMPTGNMDVNTFRIIPWPAPKMYDTMADPLKDLVRQGVLGFAKKNSEKNPWQRMLPAMRTFFG